MQLHLRGEEPPRAAPGLCLLPLSPSSHPRSLQHRRPDSSSIAAAASPACSRRWAKAPRAEMPPAELLQPNPTSKCHPLRMQSSTTQKGGEVGGGGLWDAALRASLVVGRPQRWDLWWPWLFCPHFWWALCSGCGVSQGVQCLNMNLEHC